MKINAPSPKLSPDCMLEIAGQLIQAQDHFSKIPILTLVRYLAQASAIFHNPKAPQRQKAEVLLGESSGLSQTMLSFILDDLFSELTEKKLLALLNSELGNPRQLDCFVSLPGDQLKQRAFGPRLTVQILPSTVIGVAIISLVTGLLVKSANLLRVSAEELPLVTLFLQTLKGLWPDMPKVIEVMNWDKTQTELTTAAFQKADLVIAYGRDETLTKLKPLIPDRCKMIFHGHKLSFGLIARESITNELAEKVALDVSLFEQQGCLSPQLYYVEMGGTISPLEFAEQLAKAMASVSLKWPAQKCSAQTSSQIQQLRGALPLKGGRVFASQDSLAWTVLYDPDPTFAPSPLARTIWIKAIPDLSNIPQFIGNIAEQIQAIGIALPDSRAEEIVSAIAAGGGCRICPIGEMQHPPLNWMHDGSFRLLPLLRFVRWETPGSTGGSSP